MVLTFISVVSFPSMSRKSSTGSRRPQGTAFKSPLQLQKTSQNQVENVKDDAQELGGKLEAVNLEIAELESRGLKIEMLQLHIDKLHLYNELKDYAQMVLGRIAVLEGVRTKDLYPRYNLDLGD
ncbi:DNA repair protein SWI5 homolog isoform X1 [Crassostrea virginica]